MKTRNLNSFVKNYFVVGLIAAIGLTISTVAGFEFLVHDDSRVESVKPSSDSLVAITNEHAAQGTSIRADVPLPELQEILSRIYGSNRPERLLILNGLFAGAIDNDLDELLDRVVEVSESIYSFEIQRAITQELASRNPVNAMASIRSAHSHQEFQLAEIVIQEWSVQDLDGAVEFARTLDPLGKTSAMDGILKSRPDLSRDRLLKIAASLDVESHLLDRFAIVAMEEKIEDPKGTWHRLFREQQVNWDELSEAQEQRVVRVGSLYLAGEGLEALRDILETLSQTELHNSIVELLVERVALDDAPFVLNLIRSADGLDQNILGSMLRAYARVDPKGAFETAHTADEGSVRLQRAVVDIWANSDPRSLLDSLERLPVLLRSWGHEHALISLVRRDPASATAALEDIDDDHLKRNISRSLAFHWAQVDPQSAFDWSKSSPISDELQNTVLRRVTLQDPQLAMKIALGEELNDGVGLEASVIAEVATFNVDRAMSMLADSRNLATRMAAFPGIGRALVAKGRSDQAIALVKDASREAKREYFNLIVNAWAESDYEDLYRKRNELPDDEQTIAAVAIALVSVSFRKVISFDADQEVFLRKHLPPPFLPNLDR